VLPNLIVIGAAKCGTTSLHEYLDLHPEIAMSREKELNFFVAHKNWARGLDWYESNFEPAPVRGESSPTYSVHPLMPGVPERIAELVPDVRLVYLVRDPIDRVVSHYVHRTVNWPEMGTLDDALADEDVRAWLVTPSYYWRQLEQYLLQFENDRILVLDSDDLGSNRAATLRRVFEFLGVDPEFQSGDFEQAHNQATGRTRRTRAGAVVSSALARTLGPERSRAVRERTPRAVKARFIRELPAPELTDALREELRDELQPEVDRLRSHTGLAFAGWSL
jgi:Sulfotransferase domain